MHRDDYDDRINKLIKPFKVFYDGKKSKMIDEDFFELLDGFDKKTEHLFCQKFVKKLIELFGVY